MTTGTPSHLTAEFWDAARRGVLVRPVCDSCQGSFFSPQVACPRCHSEHWSYRPSSGRGRVYSHTTVHRPPEPEFVGPYVLAVVDVDEDGQGGGWSLLTRLVGDVPLSSDEPGHLIGCEVEVAFTEDPLDTDRALPTFRIVGPTR